MQRKNDFCLVTQREVQGTELRRPDGVPYVNGLPLVVLEFKSAVREEATLSEAHHQVTICYGRDIPELRRFAAFVVLSDGVKASMAYNSRPTITSTAGLN